MKYSKPYLSIENTERPKDSKESPKSYLAIKDSGFPFPYPQQLEYSSPARGVWNIVHTGMLIPECHEIFVCAKGCLRGVVLTAAEMGEMGRYSALEIQEKYVITGHIEEFMIRGVQDILNKLSYRPKAVLLFINCQHFFLAYDQKYVFRRLRDENPDIDFADCYMIPTLRKSGMSPDRKMRIQLYSLLKKRTEDPTQVNLMGSNHSINRSCELYYLLESNGFHVTSLNDCKTYEDYQNLAKGMLNIIYEPQAENAAKDMKKRLGIPYVYLRTTFSNTEIISDYTKLHAELYLDARRDYIAEVHQKATEAMHHAKQVIGDAPIAVDYTFTFRILSFAKRLLREGFNLKRIYVDVFLPEEREDFEWLQRHYPEVEILPTSRPEMRRKIVTLAEMSGALPSGNDTVNDTADDASKAANKGSDGSTNSDTAKILAIGQKAAYFEQTPYFVDVTEGGGFFGFDGIIQIAKLMEDAFNNRKDTEKLVQKKGYGCECILGQDPAEYASCASQLTRIDSSGITESASLIPTYSSDEFGVCSALYDMGGMVVMHDASGCNSTYTTHDEPRWYDSESLVYISAVSERESILGDDGKLVRDILDAAHRLDPKFIGLVGAPIPYMTGTDLRGIAKVIEKNEDIVCMGFNTNGMRDYVSGMSMALKGIAQRYCVEHKKDKVSNDNSNEAAVEIVSDEKTHCGNKNNTNTKKVFSAAELSEKLRKYKGAEKLKINLIGMTPLDYMEMDSVERVKNWADANDIEVVSSIGMNGSLEEIADAGSADVDLVLSSGGIECAEYLKAEFGIPYVVGVPFTAQDDKLKNFLCGTNKNEILIIGEYVTSKALANAIESRYKKSVRVVTMLETREEIIDRGDMFVCGEDSLVRELKKFEESGSLGGVIADPFFKVICPESAEFFALPHRAFSGRIFDDVKTCDLW